MPKLLDRIISRAATFTPSGVSVEARTVSGLVTTQKVDSHRSIILTEGLNWERYLKNPVFAAQHATYKLALGQCIDLQPNPAEGRVACTFELNETEDGEDYLQAYARGDCRGFSICGRITDYVTRWDGEEAIKSLPEFCQRAFLDGSCLYVVRKMTVHEISAVTVPSNDETLVFRSAKEADLEFDIDVLRHQIDQLHTQLLRAKPKQCEDDVCEEPCEDEDEIEESKSDKVRRIASIASASLPLLNYR